MALKDLNIGEADDMFAAKPATPVDPMRIEGVVNRVIYNNNGFAIFSIDTPNGKQLTVKGSVQSIAKGMRVEAVGEMVADLKFGEQLAAKSILPVMPKIVSGGKGAMMSGDMDELSSYLGSVLPGVGPFIAKKIVAKFGANTIRIIERDHGKLVQIRGITDVGAELIRAAWMKNIATHQIFIFLNSHGLSLKKAADIVEEFGGSAEALKARITQNPYMICAVDGVGFKTADSFAASLGIKGSDPERIKRGIEYAFLENVVKNGGSTGAELSEILKMSALLLESPQRDVLPILEDMIEGGQLFTQVGDTIYHHKYYQIERSIAADLSRLLNTRQTAIPDLESKIARAEKEIGKGEWVLSESQRTELAKLLGSQVNILTGFPGTGKTTILSVMLHVLRASGRDFAGILQAAPSGKAAKRMQEATNTDASTCHRMLGFKNGDFDYDRNNPLPAKVLILDEWSMSDVPLMSWVLRAAPNGCKVMFVGDVDQLPSVGPGRVFADMIESGCIPVARLTEIRRQGAGSLISVAAKDVNNGIVPSKFGEALSAHLVDENATENLATIAATKIIEIIRSMTARGIDMDDIQVLSPMKGSDCGTNKLNEAIQKVVNPNISNPALRLQIDDKLFAVGDRVIQTKNDYEALIFNGDSGKITHINTENRSIFVNFGTASKPLNVEVQSNKLDKIELFFAGTIHKSQGSEFKHVIMPVINSHHIMLKKNIVYTGITRGRDSVSLVMDTAMKAMRAAVNTEDSRRRVTSLKMHIKELCAPVAQHEFSHNEQLNPAQNEGRHDSQLFDDAPM